MAGGGGSKRRNADPQKEEMKAWNGTEGAGRDGTDTAGRVLIACKYCGMNGRV